MWLWGELTSARSFVCQFKIDMFFTPSQDDTEQFVKCFGRMKAWAACNSLEFY